MSASVAIVDYDMGNLLNVERACARVGLAARTTRDRDSIARADAVILPGVGAFGDAMTRLRELDLVGVLRQRAEEQKLLVGICLGLQLLFEGSDEFGNHEGLGILRGRVVRFADDAFKVPHVGWSAVSSGAQPWAQTPLEQTADGEPMYFVHSYYAVPAEDDVVLSRSRYAGIEFCSAVKHRNVVAFQFHPERSGPAGLRLYESLAHLIGDPETS